MMYPTLIELLIAGALFGIVLVILYSLICVYFLWLDWIFQREHEEFQRRELERLGLANPSPTTAARQKGSKIASM